MKKERWGHSQLYSEQGCLASSHSGPMSWAHCFPFYKRCEVTGWNHSAKWLRMGQSQNDSHGRMAKVLGRKSIAAKYCHCGRQASQRRRWNLGACWDLANGWDHLAFSAFQNKMLGWPLQRQRFLIKSRLLASTGNPEALGTLGLYSCKEAMS